MRNADFACFFADIRGFPVVMSVREAVDSNHRLTAFCFYVALFWNENG